MTRRTRTVLLTLVAVVGAGLLWMILAPGAKGPRAAQDDPLQAGAPEALLEPGAPRLRGSAEGRSADVHSPEASVASAPETPPSPTDGSIVLFGHVLDEQGHRVRGGRLHVRILSSPKPRASLSTERGRFVVRLPAEDAGRVMLHWRDAERTVTPLRFVKPAPGEVVGPLVLVARPYATLVVRVRGENGEVVPGATVATQGNTPIPRQTFSLDGEGTMQLRVPASPVGLSASSPDGRFRAWRRVQVAPGSQETVELVLAGPWESLAVQCSTQPAGQLAGETAHAQIRIGDVTTYAEVVIDGGEQLVMLPPPSDEIVRIDAWLGQRARMHRTESSWRRLRSSLSRKPLSLVLTCLGVQELTLQTPGGEPLGPFELIVHNMTYVTDERGRVSLQAIPDGRHAIRSGGHEVGEIQIGSPRHPQTLVIPGLAEVGGAYAGPAKVGPYPLRIELNGGLGQGYRGFADAEAGRWHAWVPLAPGKRIEVVVRQNLNLRAFSEPVAGLVGQRDLDLVVHATSLEVIPRLGSVRFPQGHVRLRGVDVAMGSSAQIGSHMHSVTFAPIPPGTYELDWSSDRCKTWRAAPGQVVVGENPVRIEVAFPVGR